MPRRCLGLDQCDASPLRAIPDLELAMNPTGSVHPYERPGLRDRSRERKGSFNNVSWNPHGASTHADDSMPVDFDPRKGVTIKITVTELDGFLTLRVKVDQFVREARAGVIREAPPAAVAESRTSLWWSRVAKKPAAVYDGSQATCESKELLRCWHRDRILKVAGEHFDS